MRSELREVEGDDVKPRPSRCTAVTR